MSEEQTEEQAYEWWRRQKILPEEEEEEEEPESLPEPQYGEVEARTRELYRTRPPRAVPVRLSEEERRAVLRGPSQVGRGFAEPKFLTITDAYNEKGQLIPGITGILPCEANVEVVDAKEGVLRGTCQTEEIFPGGYTQPRALEKPSNLGRDSIQCVRNATEKRNPQTLKDEIEIMLGCGNGPRNPCLTGSQAAALMRKDRDEVELEILGILAPKGEVLIQDPQAKVTVLEAKERERIEYKGQRVTAITGKEREELQVAREEVSNPNNPRWWFGEPRYCLRTDLRKKVYQDGEI